MIITGIKQYNESSKGPLPKAWPFSLQAFKQLSSSGLSFTRPITVLVGENGVGKSTLVETIAEAYGLDVRGGHGGRRYASVLPKGPLSRALDIELTSVGRQMRQRHAPGYFLRSETALGVFEFMSDHNVPGYGDRHLKTLSHGESYLQVFEGRFNSLGLYLLDEPEAGLSFQSCLQLIEVLRDLERLGSQVILATHSPLLAAIPGAALLEMTRDGIAETKWNKLQLVDHWRRFLDRPQFYL